LRTVETAHHIAEVLELPVLIEHGAIEWLDPSWFAQMPTVTSPKEVHSLVRGGLHVCSRSTAKRICCSLGTVTLCRV
jgi:hypothetical protein